ncbi:cytochrome P450 [Novosphingobium sp. JCM 18896]|uniref:cytochrome P450 n=1 Tax=Novosphingobium sp. JCM 18896 TaxID=2989731 RepID=UPI002222327F|nr:cytochrome P450 [Novosphingobium sp. JCM 18896]MCW1431626.1 cytochrome P450 [Novosphingobium sp. JCM 18896]
MITATTEVPPHVPKDRVWDHNLAAFLQGGDDPFVTAGRLHDGPGAIWVPTAAHGGPAWVLTQHALIEKGFADWEMFSSKRGANAAVMDSSWLLLPVEADRPEHRHYRNVLNPLFTPAAMKNRNSAVQDLCDQLIDSFVDRGSCEFVSEFAAILPNAIVISLLGLPAEALPQFLAWEEEIIHGATPESSFAAGQAIIDYLKQHIASEQARPQASTDVMQAILTGRFADRALNEAEILGIVYLLFVAGLDTVTSTLGWIMRYLAIDQKLQTRLRENPHDIPAAIEEFSRAYGVSAPSRTVARDVEFDGVTMKAGDPVLLPTMLAGRDPRVWDNPHVIDIDRRPRHVTFGTGPHVCLGVHLAKREMRIMLEAFLGRMRNIRLPEGGRYEYHTTNTIGIDVLDLEWDPA